MKVGLCGLGKAGKCFVEYLMDRDDVELTTVLCRDISRTAGKKLHEITKLAVEKDLVIERISECKPKNKPDVIIDFSACETTMSLLDFCAENSINLVICPTDFTEEQLDHIKQVTVKSGIGVIYAPTLTLGINVLMDYVKRLSRVFPDFQFEIIEKHPLNKPRPTKTSGYIADNIAQDNVPVSSVRLDGYIGLHEVIGADGLERITISHESCSRKAFARGALYAADFILGKQGFYSINEVLRQVMVGEEYLA